MVNIYKCQRCGKVYDHKNNFRKHMNRKNPCKISEPSPIKEVQINSQRFKCIDCNKIFTRKDNLKRHKSKYCKNNNNTPKRSNIILSIENLPKKKNKEFICSYCKKNFSRNFTLKRHLSICKIRIAIEYKKEEIYNKLKEEMKEQQKEMKEQQKEMNELRNEINRLKLQKFEPKIQNANNIQNAKNISNINNTFNIITFGNEDLYQIYSEDEIKKILKTGYQSIYNLIDKTHFDANKPEYHNVYISNMKDVYAMIYDEGKWILKDKSEVVDQLFDDKFCYLSTMYKELQKTLDHITRKKFSRLLMHNDETTTRGLKKDIKLMLYNKRDIPLNTKRNQSLSF